MVVPKVQIFLSYRILVAFGFWPGLTKFSGSDEKRGAPGELGACKDGAQYYEVKFGSGSRSKTNNINGCYEKIDFHSVPLVATGKKFPIYKQTGASGSLYLRIDENKDGAPWIIEDSTSNIKYE